MRPATIYYIEERTGPSREGPWSEWNDGPRDSIFPRPFTSAVELTAEQCRARCVRIGADGEIWKELRCIPYHMDDREGKPVVVQFIAARGIKPESWLHDDRHRGAREFRAFYNYVRNKTNAIQACAAASAEDLYYIVSFLDHWRERVREGLEPAP